MVLPGFTLLRSQTVWGDLKPNFANARAPPPILLCPCIGIITNSLVKIKGLTGQRGDEGGGGSRGFGTLSNFVLPSSCFVFQL